ncbi:Hpt domain-containing protein [Thiothrix caldifontis]|uniref:Hpt domain-containing protein n=1 Tax=Thiothrix caldifontis TaxID=525918 RepID=A0A1H4EA35_9GAMM|nr:Hpt domain-containing protein [Thiothrix caldifontis]SEA81687.1 Hpt domain-containing protein [Thiothrix caldifontis]
MTHITPVDEETYALLQEIMADEFTELVEFFLTDTEQSLVLLQHCVATQDSTQVGTLCHKLKSSSKLIGAFQLAEFTNLLEDYKDHHDQQIARTHLNHLCAEFTQVVGWLKQKPAIA